MTRVDGDAHNRRESEQSADTGATGGRKRVLFVSSMDLTGRSGGNIATREIAAAFGRHPELDLSLVCPKPSGRSLPVLADALHTWYLPAKPAGTMKWHAKSQVAAARILPRAYRAADPDMVVARVGPSTILTPLSTIISRTPYTILVRGMVNRNLRFGPLIDAVVRFNAAVADNAYVAYSEIIDEYNLDSLTRASVFPNAVNPEQFRPIPTEEARAVIDANFKSEDFVIGFVGSLKRRHCVETLLHAVAGLPQDVPAHVLLVGDGPEHSDLERTADELGLTDSVTFIGHVAHSELSPYIGSCDVTYGVVDPSNPSNPIKCYEYLACERPVVTTATDELAFVGEQDVGVALERVAPETVRDALHSLWKTDAGIRAEMGRRGRKYVVENHSWDQLADLIVDFEV